MTKGMKTRYVGKKAEELLEYALKIFEKSVDKKATVTIAVDGDKLFEFERTITGADEMKTKA